MRGVTKEINYSEPENGKIIFSFPLKLRMFQNRNLTRCWHLPPSITFIKKKKTKKKNITIIIIIAKIFLFIFDLFIYLFSLHDNEKYF